MSNVVTQADMQKYQGTDKAIFPAETIITPAARDWANERNIKIIISDIIPGSDLECKSMPPGIRRNECLSLVIKAIVKGFRQKGMPVNAGMIAKLRSLPEKAGM